MFSSNETLGTVMKCENDRDRVACSHGLILSSLWVMIHATRNVLFSLLLSINSPIHVGMICTLSQTRWLPGLSKRAVISDLNLSCFCLTPGSKIILLPTQHPNHLSHFLIYFLSILFDI